MRLNVRRGVVYTFVASIAWAMLCALAIPIVGPDWYIPLWFVAFLGGMVFGYLSMVRGLRR